MKLDVSLNSLPLNRYDVVPCTITPINIRMQWCHGYELDGDESSRIVPVLVVKGWGTCIATSALLAALPCTSSLSIVKRQIVACSPVLLRRLLLINRGSRQPCDLGLTRRIARRAELLQKALFLDPPLVFRLLQIVDVAINYYSIQSVTTAVNRSHFLRLRDNTNGGYKFTGHFLWHRKTFYRLS